MFIICWTNKIVDWIQECIGFTNDGILNFILNICKLHIIELF